MNIRFPGRTAALCLILALSSRDGPAQSPPAISVTTRIVSVDVVVEDSGGHIVSGLTAKDFSLSEDRHDQRLLSFADHTGAVSSLADADHALMGYTFSNTRAGVQGNAVNIILVDQFNTPGLEQPYAQEQLLQFFKTMSQGEQAGLFVLSPGLHMLQGFTSDRAQLLAAAKRLNNLPSEFKGSESDRQRTRDQSEREKEAGNSMGPRSRALAKEEVIAYRHRAFTTNEALGELTQAVHGYRGRKNLIWLSGSFPAGIGPSLQTDGGLHSLSQNIDLPGLRDNTVAMASSQIAIYPISTHGVASPGHVGAESSGEGEVSPSGNRFLRTTENQFGDQYELQASAENLAALTGGRAFLNTNDISNALKRSLDEGQHYYTLDYAPSNTRWNGAYRRIAVALRTRGYRVAYRRGYFATPAPSSEADNAAHLGVALGQSGLDATGIALKAKMEPIEKQPDARTVDIYIDPATVTFANGTDGLHRAKLLILLFAGPTGAGVATKLPSKRAVLNIGLEDADYSRCCSPASESGKL